MSFSFIGSVLYWIFHYTAVLCVTAANCAYCILAMHVPIVTASFHLLYICCTIYVCLVDIPKWPTAAW